MTQGFIKLNRENGVKLLEADPQAFLLLTQIAMRARRMDGEYSMIPLKANQAFLGDHEKAGLSQQQYRNTKKRLVRYGLATFEPTNKGTVATLTSTEVYDINAEPAITLNQQSISSMKTQEKEQTKNEQATSEKPTGIKQGSNHEPVTRMKECKKATTATRNADVALYECLQNHQHLSTEEKQSLMVYPEIRVQKAIEWVSRVQIKQTLIQALHWHCKQATPPLPPENSFSGKTPQEVAAWEYTRFLETHGYPELVAQNREVIPQHYMYLISNGTMTTISLNNPIDTVKKDIKSSMNEIQNIRIQ